MTAIWNDYFVYFRNKPTDKGRKDRLPKNNTQMYKTIRMQMNIICNGNADYRRPEVCNTQTSLQNGIPSTHTQPMSNVISKVVH